MQFPYLRIGQGQPVRGTKILADCFEAVLGELLNSAKFPLIVKCMIIVSLDTTHSAFRAQTFTRIFSASASLGSSHMQEKHIP